MDIIDVHAHIYPEKIALKAAKSIGDFYHLHMHHDGKIETLIEENRKANIGKSIIHSVAVKWENADSINTFIAKEVENHGSQLIGFATVHPEDPKITQTLDKGKKQGLRGIKLHPDFQKFSIDDQKAYPIYQWASENHFPILVHTGDFRYETSSPFKMANILREFPQMQVVCAHLGAWSQWEEGHRVLAKFENAWVDTSSSLYVLEAEKGRKIIEKFNRERVLFGTDFPMWNPKEEVERFFKLGFNAKTNEAILSKNANKLLKTRKLEV